MSDFQSSVLRILPFLSVLAMTPKATMTTMTMMMAYRHIPTMTDSHHGGVLSVMIMVGICQVTKSHH